MGTVDARLVTQVEVRFPQVRGEGKRGWCSVVWQAMGPAEKCVVMRNLVRALLEEFVVGASRAARVTRALWIGGPLTLEPQPITADSPSGVLETRGFQVQTVQTTEESRVCRRDGEIEGARRSTVKSLHLGRELGRKFERNARDRFSAL
jgi:hypothetical protein